MSQRTEGNFSNNLLSLQLQLKTLLDGAGGEDTIAFLDLLSNLYRSEQKASLALFSKVLRRIINGDKRFLAPQDQSAKKFEEELYRDILEAIQDNREPESKRLSVVKGGRFLNRPEKAPISLEEARKARQSGVKPSA